MVRVGEVLAPLVAVVSYCVSECELLIIIRTYSASGCDFTRDDKMVRVTDNLG